MTAGEIKDDDMMGEPGVSENKLSESEDKILRLRAEIENLHRRFERDINDAHKYGVKKLLEELIPVLDSLEQALTVKGHEHELVNSMRDGMELTLQLLKKTLEKFGVKEINPLNQIFNPAFHEVMLAQPSADVAPNTIIQVMQKGYQLHERLIRPARVIIAKAA